MPIKNIDKIVKEALKEDAAFRDVTTRALISRKLRGKSRLLAKQDLVLCGMPLFKKAFQILDPKIKVKTSFKDGAKIKKNTWVAEVSGPAAAILSAERVALNFLQRLSGVATLTRKYVDQTRGCKVHILDTRKTTPGMRVLERYAVRTGGGKNHRFDLQSVAMAKDNHLALAGSVGRVLGKLQRLRPKVPVIIEVQNLEDFREALRCGAEYVQLDNMSLAQLKEAVRLAKGRCKLEATGGVTLKNIRQIAQSGVDYISIGALTHSAPAVDLSLEMVAFARRGPPLN